MNILMYHENRHSMFAENESILVVDFFDEVQLIYPSEAAQLH